MFPRQMSTLFERGSFSDEGRTDWASFPALIELSLSRKENQKLVPMPFRHDQESHRIQLEPLHVIATSRELEVSRKGAGKQGKDFAMLGSAYGNANDIELRALRILQSG